MRRVFALGLPLAFLAAACTYDNGDADRIILDPSPPVSCGDGAQATIDVDRQIVPEAGTGLYIEYASGGHWHLQTSCDTSCDWDIIVTPEPGKQLSNVAPEALESDDSLHAFPPDSYQLSAHTTTDFDGFTFDSDPGAVVSVDAYLDGRCQPMYTYWVGDGALHVGAPSNPLSLLPSAN